MEFKTNQAELQLPVNQALALFGKLVRKLSKKLHDVQKAAISATIPGGRSAPLLASSADDSHENDENIDAATGGEQKEEKKKSWKPVDTSLAKELDEAGDEATRTLREKQRAMIDSLDLSK